MTIRVYNESKKPYHFSYGGKTYVLQPRGGGTFEPETVSHKTDSGQKGVKVRLVENKDGRVKAKPGWLDLPNEARVHLNSGSEQKRQKESGAVLVWEGAMIDRANEELEATKAETEAMRAEKAEIEAQLAALKKEQAVLAKAANAIKS